MGFVESNFANADLVRSIGALPCVQDVERQAILFDRHAFVIGRKGYLRPGIVEVSAEWRHCETERSNRIIAQYDECLLYATALRRE